MKIGTCCLSVGLSCKSRSDERLKWSDLDVLVTVDLGAIVEM